jgi:NAD(P)-dependent dehydrogenase (short-subunit alcohol dehydrogenase family)
MTDPTPSAKACAVVVGVGARQGIGGAVCARFAQAGLHVYAAGRSAERLDPLVAAVREEGGKITGVTVDATQADAVSALFDRVAQAGHVPEVVVFNAAERNLPKSFLDMTPEFVEQMWRVCCFGGFLVGQEALRRMLPQGRGTVIFTGATASLRGRAKFGGFAAAKAGLRAQAQAMAREFGPKGIHVAHVIVDGIVAGDRVRETGHGLGKAYLMTKGEDGALEPDAIAEAYWQLHRQPRSAWTHELDLRPFKEEF